MSKIKISDDLNKKLDSYIETQNLGRRSKGIVAEYAIRKFLQNEADQFQSGLYLPDGLFEEIKFAQLAANKKISEALKRKKEFKEMTEELEKIII
jgi:hypothetical protein